MMNKRILSAIVVMLCMILMTAAAITVFAAGDQSDGGGESSAVSSDSSTESASSDSSGSSGNVSSEESSDNTSSEDDDDENNSSNDDDDDDKTGNTSSSNTSSKPSGGGIVTSQGAHGGSTFINETESDLASENVSGTVPDVSGLITDEYPEEEPDEDIDDYYSAPVTTYARRIYKVIWIPAVIALLCAGGLVYVNLEYKKRYGSHGASRRPRARRSSHTAVRRR